MTALKIIAAAALLVGLASLAVVASKQQMIYNRCVEVSGTTATETKNTVAKIENADLSDHNHFVIIFAYDAKGVLRKPAMSHVFALFYETTKDGLQKDFSISWKPVGSPLKPGISEGQNQDVKQTLEYASKNNLEVQMWGPYAIDEKIYKNAVLRHNDLTSGKLRYRFIDGSNRTDPTYPAVNNVHAVSDVAGCIDTESRFGKDAAQCIVKKFETNSVVSQDNRGRDTCHEEVIKKLGVQVRQR